MAAFVDTERVASASSRYPKPKGYQPAYGTAGFRSDASLLASTVFRCGLLTAARAAVLGRPCGLMITASHNPEDDNGVKIVESGGEMLSQVCIQGFGVPLCAACQVSAGTDVHAVECGHPKA